MSWKHRTDSSRPGLGFGQGWATTAGLLGDGRGAQSRRQTQTCSIAHVRRAIWHHSTAAPTSPKRAKQAQAWRGGSSRMPCLVTGYACQHVELTHDIARRKQRRRQSPNPLASPRPAPVSCQDAGTPKHLKSGAVCWQARQCADDANVDWRITQPTQQHISTKTHIDAALNSLSCAPASIESTWRARWATWVMADNRMN